jgi:hypothetical protein
MLESLKSTKSLTKCGCKSGLRLSQPTVSHPSSVFEPFAIHIPVSLSSPTRFNLIVAVGVVAVYALNDEFKSIQRESQNGMISAGSYVVVKSLLSLPILFFFALFALLIPSYVIQDVPWSAFGLTICLYAANLFVYESVAEALSVIFENPIVSNSPGRILASLIGKEMI